MKQMIHVFLLLCVLTTAIFAQGVTTAAISGSVKDNTGSGLPGAIVMAVHVPSGTKYGTTTRDDGGYNLANLRVGGPYVVSVSILGYSKQDRDGINLQLSQTLRQDFRLSPQDVEMEAIEVTAEKSSVMNAARTGAATAISRNAIEALPTITRKVQDFSRLTPQFSGNNSFGGLDNRYNNTTIDGSYFNNSFGLQGQPGDRTGVAPVSIDAVEQVQVNIAPYDVRQGNFIGAGVNTITKSGTNEISGSVYYLYRHQGLVGQKAGDLEYKPGTFNYNQLGVRLSGPVIENKLFFFGSFENDKTTQPGTTFRTRATTADLVSGNQTRVLDSDMSGLSSYLASKFNYITGPYQDYNNETPALRFLAKLDYNLDDKNKLILRYIHLNSKTDVLVSNSNSLGIGGNRQNSLNGMSFQNSNYQIGENIRNIIGEWNSILGDNMSNNLIVGYSFHDESRESRGAFFPFVDILGSGGTNYMSFGYEPFTPNNELRYSSFQIQDNFSYSLGDHYLTLGASVEKYQSENIFFPGAQSAYVYNDLDDFYSAANGYLANPARTTSDSTLRRFEVRWSNVTGQVKPIQDLKVLYTGFYAQDEYQMSTDIRLSLGLRLDVPVFEKTGIRNPEVDTMKFLDENRKTVKYSTDKLPNSNILWSPRVGFNWDVTGDRTTQLRGGTGIFTGKPAYVWISNQIGNNGMLTGFEQLNNTKARPFDPNPARYKKAANDSAASSYELALTDPDFKFPQLWRSNIAIDQQLPFNMTATAEFLYSKDVNGVYYINANLPVNDSVFVGVDARPRWKITDKIYSKVVNAIVMKNQDVGYSWNLAFSLEKAFSDGWFAKAAYSYGVSKNTVDPSSIAAGNWTANAQSGNPNNPGVGFSNTSPGHRIFLTASYRLDYFEIGATTISVFWQGNTIGNASYTFSGDLNGDRATSNDLIYIPKDQSEMNFKALAATSTAPAFTAQQQADAWEAFIKQDEYLSANRGKYAERGAVFMPMVYRADLSIVQEVYTEIFGKKNSLQIRADILNVSNLLNKSWGLSQRFVTTQPLTSPSVDAGGKVTYNLAKVGASLISKTFEQTALLTDVFQIQLGVRYTFN